MVGFLTKYQQLNWSPSPSNKGVPIMSALYQHYIDIITRLSFDTGWNFSDLQLTVMWLAIQSRSIMVGGYYYKYACVRVRRSMAQGSCLANQMKCLPKFKCVCFFWVRILAHCTWLVRNSHIQH